jgi:hypothetical protein
LPQLSVEHGRRERTKKRNCSNHFATSPGRRSRP